MSSTETVHALTPEQRRLLAPFVRRYERQREHTALVRQQAQAAIQQAEADERAAGQDMLRAGALAVGGRADLIVDYDTFEVKQRAPAGEDGGAEG